MVWTPPAPANRGVDEGNPPLDNNANVAAILDVQGKLGDDVALLGGRTSLAARLDDGRLVAPAAFEGANPVAGVPYGVVIEGAGTNHVTNPRFAIDLTGWEPDVEGGAPAATLERLATGGVVGPERLRVTSTAAGGWQGARIAQAHRRPAAAGEVWTASAWADKLHDVSGILCVAFYDAAGILLHSPNTQIAYNASMQRIWLAGTAPANTATVGIRFVINGVSSVLVGDGFQLEQAAQPSTYIDGSLGPGYAWTGTAHASASTRTAGTKVLSDKPRLDVGEAHVSAPSSSRVPLTVKGAANQSNNLFESRRSDGWLLGRVDNNGGVEVVGAAGTTGATPVFRAGPAGITNEPILALRAGYGSHLPLRVRGATDQATNLTEWQNGDGSTAAWINAGGNIQTGAAPALLDSSGSYGSMLAARCTTANHLGLIVRGAASQTSPLVEFQRSDGLRVFTVDLESVMTNFATSLLLNVGALGARRVSVGGPDSAGAGYRTLRIPN